ncbi:hypothetical protein MIR68_009507 [Amoeboaphelidium protococcarum]|nr:hypothetical protein MIR68_009507 [Amoeboaphelidium protococcarum]
MQPVGGQMQGASAVDVALKVNEQLRQLRVHLNKLISLLDGKTLMLSGVSTEQLVKLNHDLQIQMEGLQSQSNAALEIVTPNVSGSHGGGNSSSNNNNNGNSGKAQPAEFKKKPSLSNWFQSKVVSKLGPILSPFSLEEKFKGNFRAFIECLERFKAGVESAIQCGANIEWEVINSLKVISHLLNDYRRYVYILIPHLKTYILYLNSYLMHHSISKRCTSLGMRVDGIPSEHIQSITLTSCWNPQQEHFSLAPNIKRIMRHPIDPRYDFRVLHDSSIYQKDGIDIVDTLPKCDGQKLMEFFTYFKDPITTNSEINEQATDGDVSCLLTATYPMIKASRLLSKDQQRKSQEGQLLLQDEMVLLNDPNADAYVLIEGSNFMIGCVADGMGAGHHARIASNLTCAVVLAKILGYSCKDQAPSQIVLNNTNDVLNFLNDIVKEAQRVMSEVEECGGTTVVIWMLTQLKEPFNNDITHVMNYVMAGDVEGYHYTANVASDYVATPNTPSSVNPQILVNDQSRSQSKKTRHFQKKWRSLHQYPRDNEGIRLNTSYTPGGIGRHHGLSNMIWGGFLNPEYVERNWQTLTGQGQAKDSIEDNGRSEFDSMSSLTDFYAHTNNLHFGQTFCEADDFFVFASDGLGDCLDPLQLYPRPYLIHGLESFSSWQQFQKEFDNAVVGYGSAMVSRDLKELAFNNALAPVMAPYGVDGQTSTLKKVFAQNDKLEVNTSSNPSLHLDISAEKILQACVKHAMDATKGDRDLYDDDTFLHSQRADKHKIMEQLIDKYISVNLPFRRYSSIPVGGSSSTRHQISIQTGRSTKAVGISGNMGAIKFGLPPVYIPFAKIDHLGIEVVRVSAPQ